MPPASISGAKDTRRPSRSPVARTVSRSTAAWSAMARPATGSAVTSNWSGPYSRTMVSTAIPACPSAPAIASQSARSLRKPESAKPSPRGPPRPGRWNSCSKAPRERQPRGRPQPLQRRPQDRARAALPGPAVEMHHVAEREVLDRPAVAEVDPRPRAHVAAEHQVAERPVGAVGDVVEAGDLHVGRRPADPRRPALLGDAGRHRLAAQLAGDVAGAEVQHRFGLQRGLRASD